MMYLFFLINGNKIKRSCPLDDEIDQFYEVIYIYMYLYI